MAPLRLLRSAVGRLRTAAPAGRAAFSSAAATTEAKATVREGVIAAAAAAVAGSGLGLWLMPPALADSGEVARAASAGQVAAAGQISAGAGAVEERHEKRTRFLLAGEPSRPVPPIACRCTVPDGPPVLGFAAAAAAVAPWCLLSLPAGVGKSRALSHDFPPPTLLFLAAAATFPNRLIARLLFFF